MWDDLTHQERCERVKTLVLAGGTMQSISRDLGAKHRNQISGFIYRNRVEMGLPPADRTAGCKRRAALRPPKPKREPKPKQAKKAKSLFSFGSERPVTFKSGAALDTAELGWKRPEIWQALPGAEPKPLVDLERGQCRWPIGEGKPFLFCGCGVVGNRPYCDQHNGIANGSAASRPLEAAE